MILNPSTILTYLFIYFSKKNPLKEIKKFNK